MADFDPKSSLDQLVQIGVVDKNGEKIILNKKYLDNVIDMAMVLVNDKEQRKRMYEEYTDPKEVVDEYVRQADILVIMKYMGTRELNQDEVISMAAVVDRLRQLSVKTC